MERKRVRVRVFVSLFLFFFSAFAPLLPMESARPRCFGTPSLNFWWRKLFTSQKIALLSLSKVCQDGAKGSPDHSPFIPLILLARRNWSVSGKIGSQAPQDELVGLIGDDDGSDGGSEDDGGSDDGSDDGSGSEDKE
ncbi:MAG: hypothetical protein JOS17DRAFT_778358 [Linnemannia elongata]|nr:MAG: hypothetical protein JOS17DRAFT_778358 [Linnemannia elongata]